MHWDDDDDDDDDDDQEWWWAMIMMIMIIRDNDDVDDRWWWWAMMMIKSDEHGSNTCLSCLMFCDIYLIKILKIRFKYSQPFNIPTCTVFLQHIFLFLGHFQISAKVFFTCTYGLPQEGKERLMRRLFFLKNKGICNRK